MKARHGKGSDRRLPLEVFLFGGRRFIVSEEDLPAAVSALLSADIRVRVDPDGGFFLPLCRSRAGEAALSGLAFSRGELLGVPGFFYKNRRRYGAFAGAALAIFLWAFSSRYVWDVRLLGLENADEAALLSELDAAGLSVGAPFSALDFSAIETRLLAASDTVGWVGIHRVGTVAYVNIRESAFPEIPPKLTAPANIVAAEDGIVEEITVTDGIAVVKPGESVRAGDLLISGVLSSGADPAFLRADGQVTARVFREISVEVPRDAVRETGKREETLSFSIKIFAKEINIFKKYGNVANGCDIIEVTTAKTLPSGKKLPFSVKKRVAVSKETEKVRLTDGELTQAALAALREKMKTLPDEGELLSVKTTGEFTENGYRMRASCVLLAGIGKTVEFGTGEIR